MLTIPPPQLSCNGVPRFLSPQAHLVAWLSMVGAATKRPPLQLISSHSEDPRAAVATKATFLQIRQIYSGQSEALRGQSSTHFPETAGGRLERCQRHCAQGHRVGEPLLYNRAHLLGKDQYPVTAGWRTAGAEGVQRKAKLALTGGFLVQGGGQPTPFPHFLSHPWKTQKLPMVTGRKASPRRLFCRYHSNICRSN